MEHVHYNPPIGTSGFLYVFNVLVFLVALHWDGHYSHISCFKASVDSPQEVEHSSFFWCPIYPHTLGCLREDKASLIGSSQTGTLEKLHQCPARTQRIFFFSEVRVLVYLAHMLRVKFKVRYGIRKEFSIPQRLARVPSAAKSLFSFLSP